MTSTPITQTYSNNGGVYIEASAQVIHRSTEGSLDVGGKSNSKLLIRNNNLKEDGMRIKALIFLKAFHVNSFFFFLFSGVNSTKCADTAPLFVFSSLY